MILYPTIELLDGRCVSLFRGNLDEPQIWHVDPRERAQAFAEAGAEWIHITDFDAVGGGNPGSGTSGNANINVQVNEQPCDNPTTVFATITLTKTVAAGGDQLVLSLTPSNCGTT